MSCRWLVVALVACLWTATGARAATAGHWCREGDPPIYASAQTSCRVAGIAVTDYVDHCHESRSCRVLVQGPGDRAGSRMVCRRTGTIHDGMVRCVGDPRCTVWARFSAEV